MSSRGAWVVAAVFVALALFNLATGVRWLAALMAILAVVNVRRALIRRRSERAGS
jgi:hypothetical protein